MHDECFKNQRLCDVRLQTLTEESSSHPIGINTRKSHALSSGNALLLSLEVLHTLYTVYSSILCEMIAQCSLDKSHITLSNEAPWKYLPLRWFLLLTLQQLNDGKNT